ncbi:MAG: hypothetical protein JO021_21995 [Alphaproteobacteria bacterium]|nr:hypothetical protein [Alphaproteobacteria bacterium]
MSGFAPAALIEAVWAALPPAPPGLPLAALRDRANAALDRRHHAGTVRLALAELVAEGRCVGGADAYWRPQHDDEAAPAQTPDALADAALQPALDYLRKRGFAVARHPEDLGWIVGGQRLSPAQIRRQAAILHHREHAA